LPSGFRRLELHGDGRLQTQAERANGVEHRAELRVKLLADGRIERAISTICES